MKIEKLNENKIRITLNLDDLKENDIDFHTFMSNSIESQELFLHMLEKAEKEVGFVTEDYRIMIEALAMANGNFILTVTRLEQEKEKGKSSYRKKKINIKRKTSLMDNEKSIYCFNSFDELCEFCTFLNNSLLKYLNNFVDSISLYEYNEKFYLVFSNIHINNTLLKSFTCAISEFAFLVPNSNLFESKLIEYGKLIIKDNAIKICIKHFC